MRLNLLALAALGASGALANEAVAATTISFPNSVCTVSANGTGPLTTCFNNAYVSQAHGDIAGALDVTYLDVDSVNGDSLHWWGAGYNTLPSALWASGSDGNSFARITLTPAAGQAIRLDSLDLGAYGTPNLLTHLRVVAVNGGSYAYSGSVGSTAGPTQFAPLLSSSTAIVIEWENSAYNVGINNITYTLAPVPEPQAAVLLLGGLALVAGLTRRRRVG